MKENECRIIKIDKDALYEFIYENFIANQEELMDMLRPLLEYYAPRDRGLIADRVCAAVLLRQKEL